MAERKAQTLAELIESLPEEERIVLLLYFAKNLSVADIATKIGVPERSVAAVLASGRARLRSSFDFPSTD
jgi:RNA polymerase sigma factor (sigma-70 family)